MEPIRLLKLGQVPAVRSQTIYHAVGRAMSRESSDTVILVSPAQPYISIGFHQEAEKEVDLNYCNSLGLPVVRREVGGGAVYLDHNQTFIQWVFHPQHLPALLEDRFAIFVRPLIKTYQALGIDAQYRPINDIHVHNKKIGGTGAARIGMAEVMVGSLMFDFDRATMARVLKVSSEKMRDKIISGLDQYMTTIQEQLGNNPDREKVISRYIEKLAATLGREIMPGICNAEEEALVEDFDRSFASPHWLHYKKGLHRSGVKINAGVRVGESAYKAPGGLIRATVRVIDERIDELSISGDFTLFPSSCLAQLEQSLQGVPTQVEHLTNEISKQYIALGVQSPGVYPKDFAKAILAAITN